MVSTFRARRVGPTFAAPRAFTNWSSPGSEKPSLQRSLQRQTRVLRLAKNVQPVSREPCCGRCLANNAAAGVLTAPLPFHSGSSPGCGEPHMVNPAVSISPLPFPGGAGSDTILDGPLVHGARWHGEDAGHSQGNVRRASCVSRTALRPRGKKIGKKGLRPNRMPLFSSRGRPPYYNRIPAAAALMALQAPPFNAAVGHSAPGTRSLHTAALRPPSRRAGQPASQFGPPAAARGEDLSRAARMPSHWAVRNRPFARSNHRHSC